MCYDSLPNEHRNYNKRGCDGADPNSRLHLRFKFITGTMRLLPVDCFFLAGACSLERPANSLRRAVVILRRSSNFGSATFPGVYFSRDCPLHFYIDAVAIAGGAELERRVRKQAPEAIPGQLQQPGAPGTGAKCDGAPGVSDRLEKGWRSAASGGFCRR